MRFTIAITALLSTSAVQAADLLVKVGANGGVSYSDHESYLFVVDISSEARFRPYVCYSRSW